MSDSMRIRVEVIFNVTYLIVIWTLVAMMARHRSAVAPADRPVAKRLMWAFALLAFALLALGDTGYVGVRVVAYALGGLQANPALVGLGALSTAYTVTLFNMLMVDIWRLRFRKPLGIAGWTLLGAGVVRLIIMAFPANHWEQIIPPYDWSLLRNALLVVQGVGVMILILRDAFRTGDTTLKWIGAMIALSYAFYAPVIVLRASDPLVGAAADARYADDPQDVRLCRDCDPRLSGALRRQTKRADAAGRGVGVGRARRAGPLTVKFGPRCRLLPRQRPWHIPCRHLGIHIDFP
jgi:hypothetical protein